MVVFEPLDIPSTVALARSCKAGHRAGQPILAMWKRALEYRYGALFHLVLCATLTSHKDIAKMLAVWACARTPPLVCMGLELKMALETHLSLSSVKWLHAMGASLHPWARLIAAVYGRLDVVTYFHAHGAYSESLIAIAIIAKQHHITEFVLTNYTLSQSAREWVERNAHNALTKAEQQWRTKVVRCAAERVERAERTDTGSKIAMEFKRRDLLTTDRATRDAREALPRVRDALHQLGVDVGMQHLA
jgi:hypothetical protein